MAVHELFAYLRAKDAEKMIAFCKRAFGATEKFRLVEPSGRIGHAELMLGNAVLMLSDEFPEYDIYAPEADARSTFVIHLHVDDADATIGQALSAGARLVRPPQDQFYGERSGTVRDPFGYDWMIGHSIEEVDPDEMQRRYIRILAQPAEQRQAECRCPAWSGRDQMASRDLWAAYRLIPIECPARRKSVWPWQATGSSHVPCP